MSGSLDNDSSSIYLLASEACLAPGTLYDALVAVPRIITINTIAFDSFSEAVESAE